MVKGRHLFVVLLLGCRDPSSVYRPQQARNTSWRLPQISSFSSWSFCGLQREKSLKENCGQVFLYRKGYSEKCYTRWVIFNSFFLWYLAMTKWHWQHTTCMLSHGFKGFWNKYAHVKFMTQYFVAFKTIYKCFFTPKTREQEQNKMITYMY